jgi:hypothetical protein
MNLQERLFEVTAQARDQADAYARQAAAATRQRIDRTADQVEAIQTPVTRLVDAGLKLNQISATYVERFVRQQSDVAQALLKGSAHQLRSLAEARSPRQAWQTQTAALDGARDRATAVLRDTWTLAKEAGREVATLAETTYATLRAPAARATKPRKAVGRTRPGRAKTGASGRSRKANAAR